MIPLASLTRNLIGLDPLTWMMKFIPANKSNIPSPLSAVGGIFSLQGKIHISMLSMFGVEESITLERLEDLGGGWIYYFDRIDPLFYG